MAEVSGSKSANSMALTAEAEANRRISQSKQLVKSTAEETEAQLKKIKSDHDTAVEIERAQNEEVLEQERSAYEEKLSAIKAAQNKEIGRLKREGNRQIEELKDYYADAFYRMETDKGQKEKTYIRDESALDALHFQKLKESQEGFKKIQGQQKEMLQTQHQDQISKIFSENAKHENLLRANSEIAKAMAADRYTETYQNLVEGYERSLGALQERTEKAITDIAQGNTDKLNAYSTQKSDPFYRLKDFDSHFSENENAYTVTARIPAQEQSKIQVTIQGDRLVVSGSRKSEEKFKTEDGTTKSSTAYQTFSESFPLKYAVEKDFLTKFFDGDKLVVTVPKKGQLTHFENLKPKVDPIQADRPRFPSTVEAALPRPKKLT